MILKFTPILKTLVWGTENWVLSGVKGSESVVAEGPLAGKTLNEVYGKEFPLLIKFIDAKCDLSIQVHPDDELAAKRHGCKGKTEMWYIIGAADGAHLLAGLSKEVNADDYVRLVAEDKIVDALADHKVAPGDVFFLPAGRIHAICGGCYLAEIQETSDITYRIYDYNRPGLDGKPRQLHTGQAKDAIDYRLPAAGPDGKPLYRTPYTPVKDAEVVVVDDAHFVTSVYDLSKPFTKDLSTLAPQKPDPATGEPMNNFLIVMCLEGAGSVSGNAIKAGEAILALAPEKSITITPSGRAKFLTSRL